MTPSLLGSAGEGPAFELKFLLNEGQAREIEGWARRLAPDPHGDPALGGAYRTTSLYFDTPEGDVYHRTPAYRRRKFRVRRYGPAPGVFLERKAKWGDRVAKRRVGIPDGELALLAAPLVPPNWPGHWFHRRLRARCLGPVCRIVYERTAYVGSCPEGPLRVTLDRRLRGILANSWEVTPFEAGRVLLAGPVILEFKFRWTLPTPFKELVSALRLSPSVVSKYRLCRDAWASPPTVGSDRGPPVIREVADA